MLLSTLGALIVSSLAGLSVAQDDQLSTVTNQSTPIASLYGDSFKNAGGKVLTEQVNVYVVFYGNWTSLQDEQTTFMNFIDGVSSTQWFSTLRQYTDSDGHGVTGPLNVAAAVNDAGSRGLTLSDANVHKQIILDAVNSGYLSPTNQIDPNGIYVLFAGNDVSDSEFCTRNCGYNSHSDQFQYMFIGYPGTCTDYCIPPMIHDYSPNESPAIDAAVTIFSHEVQDLLTDPRNDAWMIQQNGTTIELGDFCAGSDVPDGEWYGTVNKIEEKNATYNLEVGNQKFLVQTIFDLENKKCVLSKS